MVLWYANRGTGVVLVLLLSAATALGVLSTARAGSTRWPRFATQSLHRNVSLLAMVLLLAHVVTPVVDSFTDLRWFHALAPVNGEYVARHRLPMALAALAFDLLVLITVTSLVRARLPHRAWRGLHLLSYLSWALGVLHGWLLGTDADTLWSRTVTVIAVTVVALAVLVRLATWWHESRRSTRQSDQAMAHLP
ncbi:MAG: ferric reductase-like transmembrane domain-containing protein [Kineosporiaceae bacterium]|nr:ferric reductase-like transmembrane domain-containing protein [Kineosporiaceae bacterium]